MNKYVEGLVEEAKLLTLAELLYVFYTLRELIWEREA